MSTITQEISTSRLPRWRWRFSAEGIGQATYAFRANLLRAFTNVSALLAIICIMLMVAISQEGAWISIGTAFLAIAVLVRAREKEQTRDVIIKVMTLCVFVSALNYMLWRIWAINWDAWWSGIPLIAAELFGMIHTLGLQYTIWPRPEPEILNNEDPTYRPIFIFIPTVNEGSEILIRTIMGTLRARERYLAAYPHGQVSIVLCNDGYVANAPNWKEPEEVAERFKVTCITRRVKGGAKAGNIENARQIVGATGNALIVIFDADQVAEPDFLMKTIPPFSDSRMGWVQTGQYYRNLDNVVSRWANDQQALFYKVLCPNKSNQNAAFICGTNVVISAEALDEIGGLPQDSVTEDFAASIELHSHWRSIFLPDILATGLGPMTLNSYLKQQNRWAIGTLSVFRTSWKRIFLPQRNGLSAQQRIQYALACTHYLCGVRDLIFIIAPLVFLLTGIPAVKGAGLGDFLEHFIPYFVASQIAFWYVGWGKTSVRGILIGFGSFYALLGSLYTVVTGRKVGFAVTSKTRGADNLIRTLRPYLIAFFFCMLGVVVGLSHELSPLERGKTLVSVFWAVYTMMLLSGMLWLGLMDLRQEAILQRRAARAARPPRRSLVRLSPKLAVLLVPVIIVATVAAIIVPREQQALASSIPRFTVSAKGDRVLGLTLSLQDLNTAPPKVEQELHARPGIVGRTQDITDSFDRDWADGLTKEGAQPWVTLIFRLPDSPAYLSSLPAITNGFYDDLLKRWAGQISDYGKPVYITILPHVDRNWDVSSAVTNGGIPQDVPNAWLHVQQVFDDVEVKNVAWVWAPADPVHDQAYAPPLSSIDVVLLSMISYPKTTWANPQQEVSDLVTRYPYKPLFIEVSADGDPVQKASWLITVGAAVADKSTVRALFYHEGSPDLHPTPQQDEVWSLASDAQSLSAFKDVVFIAGLKSPVVESDNPSGTAPATSQAQSTASGS